jgi:hypothetical protein
MLDTTPDLAHKLEVPREHCSGEASGQPSATRIDVSGLGGQDLPLRSLRLAVSTWLPSDDAQSPGYAPALRRAAEPVS